MMKFLLRWYYTLRTIRSHAQSLNDRVDVENTLTLVATGKRKPLTREECKALAVKLGVPKALRPKPSAQDQGKPLFDSAVLYIRFSYDAPLLEIAYAATDKAGLPASAFLDVYKPFLRWYFGREKSEHYMLRTDDGVFYLRRADIRRFTIKFCKAASTKLRL